MTIDKQKLKALAEAATQSHGARQVEIDHNGVHVIGDGSWKILSAWHTPDGKGAQNAEFVAAASPATVLTLLAEIDGLHDQHGRDSGELRKLCNARDSARRERDQLKAENEDYKSGQERYEQIIEDLKAENEALRKALGKISVQVDENIRCAVRDVVNGLPDVQDIYGYCDNIDEIIEAAMAKETNHD